MRPGTRHARSVAAGPDRRVDVLADHDEGLLAAYIEQGPALPCALIRAELAAQVGEAKITAVGPHAELTAGQIGWLRAWPACRWGARSASRGPELAEQDPVIDLRQDDVPSEVSVRP